MAPFPKLQEIAREVVKQREDEWLAGIEIVSGNLEAGVTAVKQVMTNEVRAIISRGGTALLIARELNVPVIEIKTTVPDVLRALGKIPIKQGPIGIVGFSNVITPYTDMIELFGTSLRIVTIDEHSQVKEKILAAVRDGVRVVVGDYVAVQAATELGLNAILIESGKDAVEQALEEAQKLVGVRSKRLESSELLNTIIESSTDGIIYIDRDERIIIFNPMAEEIFSVSADCAIGRPVTEVIPNTRLPLVVAKGIPEIGEIQQVGSKMIATKRIPIKIGGEVIGAVANFQDVTQLQRYEHDIRQKLYAKGLIAKMTIDDIVGTSPAIKAAKERACQYGETSSTVLITGESGTGKEMFAQSIHNLSERRKGPFVAVNCASLPENLLESELFGYEEGAFTGARKGGKMGLIEIAHNGTIFLDEISEMNLVLQSRLLRVLQEKEVMRLGGDRLIAVDVRFIAATNQNLQELIQKKQFRQDLYYRLDILRLHIPPLRERATDIPILAEFFIDKFCRQHKKHVRITPGVMKLLKRYHWPGNIRELANILERAVLLASGDKIEENCIREALLYNSNITNITPSECETPPTADSLSNLEQHTIKRILVEEGYNYSKAAARLGINRTTLWRKLHKLD